MNNIKYYNDSLAYDFEMFMPRPAKVQNSRENIVAMPKVAQAQRKRRRTAAKAMSASAFVVMLAAFVLAALCGNISLRLMINETNSEINNIKAAISDLESEETSLEVEMQRRISFSNLELEAVQMGMKKLEKEDVTYIRVNDKDAARTSDGKLITAE